MSTFITGKYDTTLKSVTQKDATNANTNHAPSWCTGTNSSDLGLAFLRRIANAS